MVCYEKKILPCPLEHSIGGCAYMHECVWLSAIAWIFVRVCVCVCVCFTVRVCMCVCVCMWQSLSPLSLVNIVQMNSLPLLLKNYDVTIMNIAFKFPKTKVKENSYDVQKLKCFSWDISIFFLLIFLELYAFKFFLGLLHSRNARFLLKIKYVKIFVQFMLTTIKEWVVSM